MGTKQWTVPKRLVLPSLQPRLWMPVPRNPHQSKNVMAPSSPRHDSLCRRFDGGRSKELRMLMGETEPKTVAQEAAKHWLTWWTSHRLGIAQHCMNPFGRTPAGRSDCMCVCVMWIIYLCIYIIIYIHARSIYLSFSKVDIKPPCHLQLLDLRLTAFKFLMPLLGFLWPSTTRMANSTANCVAMCCMSLLVAPCWGTIV